MKSVSGEIRSTTLPLRCLVPDTLLHMQNNVNNIGTECLAEKLAKFKKVILILTYDIENIDIERSCACYFHVML